MWGRRGPRARPACGEGSDAGAGLARGNGWRIVAENAAEAEPGKGFRVLTVARDRLGPPIGHSGGAPAVAGLDVRCTNQAMDLGRSRVGSSAAKAVAQRLGHRRTSAMFARA